MDGELEWNEHSGCWEGYSEDGRVFLRVEQETMWEARHMATMRGESKTVAYPRLLQVAVWLEDDNLRELDGIGLEW